MRRAGFWISLAVCFAACPTLDKKAAPNEAPRASLTVSPSGPVARGERVTLDGTASADPEGKALRFRWSQVSGDAVALSGAAEAVTSFEAPDRPQILMFTLVVSDGRAESAPAYARVVVDFNTAPRAEVPDSREVPNGTSVLLTGRGSDADGDALVSYQWSVDAAPSASGVAAAYELSGQTSSTAVFRPLLKGLHVLSLRVSDSRGAQSLPAQLVINALNVRPVARAGDPQEALSLTPVVLTGSGFDPDPTDTLRYAWTLESLPAGAPLPGLSGQQSAALTVTPKAPGTYGLSLVVSDGEQDSEPSRVVLVARNNPPTATGAPLQTPNRSPLQLTAQTSDPDGDPVSLEWAMKDAAGKPYTLAAGPGGTTTFTPLAKGSYLLSAVPFDGVDRGPPAEVTVTSTNLPPVAVASASISIASVGETIVLSASGSGDPDGPTPLRYAWSVKQGSAGFDGGSTAATVYAQSGPLKQALQFQLEVFDEVDAGSAPATVQVVVDNAPPVAAAGSPDYLGAGELYPLDGTQSYDLESPSSQLLYKWSSPSHPDAGFLPSDSVASPTLLVPPELGATLVVSLTVSDARVVSAPSVVSHTIVPGSATNLFVRSNSGCGADAGVPCDGTRARPYRTITEAAQASAALALPKPVLVAAGTYPAATIGPGISVSGGCSPIRWSCDGAEGASVIQAADSELVALQLTGSRPQLGTVRGFTVYGAAAPDAGVAVTGVRCDGCSVKVEAMRIEANGSTAADATYGVVVTNTGGPVRFDRVEAVAGRGRWNAGFLVSGVNDLRVERSFITTLAKVRSSGSGSVSENSAIFLGGAGGNVAFDRNRIYVEGDSTLGKAHLVFSDGNQYANFSGNFFWFKAAALGAGTCCGDSPPNDALLFGSNSRASLSFVNNTFLGNDLAWNLNNGFNLFHFYYNPWCNSTTCAGNSGLSFATNNYVEKFRKLVTTNTGGGTVRMKHNSLSTVGSLSCSPYTCTSNPSDLNTGFGPVVGGGAGNSLEDCALANPSLGDFHLPADGGSPCVDTGLADPLSPALDLDGEPRPSGLAIDRGADEVP